MNNNSINNSASLYADESQTSALTSATNTILLADSSTLTMTKTADKTSEYYFSGDTITYTITINNTGTLNATGLYFVDNIPTGINPSNGTNYVVSSGSGTITSSANPVTIDNISIPAGGNVTITIQGIIA